MDNQKKEDSKLEKESIEGQTKAKNIVLTQEQFDKLIADRKEQDVKIEMLMRMADKGRLEKENAKNAPIPGKSIKLSKYQGKIVLSWAMLRNDVFKDPVTNAWREFQVIKMSFDDDTTQELDYLSFVKFIEKVKATVVSKQKDIETGIEILKVECEGKEYTIDAKFAN